MTERPRLTDHGFAPRRHRSALPRWRDARQAFDALMADPDDTQKALDVLDALDPDALQRDFARFLSRPSGRRLYDARSSLREALDPDVLRALPADSFGRAYLAHLEDWDLDTEKLFALNWDHANATDADEGLRWFIERNVLLHDLWHVLSGYGADDLGEAALLPFSFAQRGGLGQGLLSLGSVFHAWRQARWDWPREALEAWLQGRRAVDLACVPYEDIVAEPLDEVRRALGLRPPEVVHRGPVPRSESSALQRRAEAQRAA